MKGKFLVYAGGFQINAKLLQNATAVDAGLRTM